jgi:hypothetical protein
MSDPTGTLGGRSPASDVDIAMSGGGDFMARLKQLGDAKDAAARALAELKLAKTAQATMAEADAKRRSADDASQLAQKALADAQAQATDIVQEAQARGMRLANDAQAKADKLRADGAQAKKDAITEASGIRKEAAKALADAEQKLKYAEAARVEARVAADAQNSALQATQDAAADYRVAKARYEAKSQRIKAFVAELERDS